jgi:hypothetical protein
VEKLCVIILYLQEDTSLKVCGSESVKIFSLIVTYSTFLTDISYQMWLEWEGHVSCSVRMT